MSCATKMESTEGPNVVDINCDYKEHKGGNSLATLFEVNTANVLGLLTVAAVCWAGVQLSGNNSALEKQAAVAENQNSLITELNSEVKSLRTTINSQGTMVTVIRSDLNHTLSRVDKLERQQENMEQEVMTYLLKGVNTNTLSKE